LQNNINDSEYDLKKNIIWNIYFYAYPLVTTVE
jgi:hypothetical protein